VEVPSSRRSSGLAILREAGLEASWAVRAWSLDVNGRGIPGNIFQRRQLGLCQLQPESILVRPVLVKRGCEGRKNPSGEIESPPLIAQSQLQPLHESGSSDIMQPDSLRESHLRRCLFSDSAKPESGLDRL
jgi:hypothetical protein